MKQQQRAYGAELQAQMAAGDAAKRRDKMDRMGINPQPQQQQQQQTQQQQGELRCMGVTPQCETPTEE